MIDLSWIHNAYWISLDMEVFRHMVAILSGGLKADMGLCSAQTFQPGNQLLIAPRCIFHSVEMGDDPICQDNIQRLSTQLEK